MGLWSIQISAFSDIDFFNILRKLDYCSDQLRVLQWRRAHQVHVRAITSAHSQPDEISSAVTETKAIELQHQLDVGEHWSQLGRRNLNTLDLRVVFEIPSREAV